ncbi:polysaccharide biosynthesis protein [Enterococcus sp. JM9B]|uniref:polysaccharide biosynthesis protein n=1 Tax=Enterococcus sp. JM9B TaxID=1857216 RepID=UPI001374AE28|nr:nucleoside-diphosphate sugar epimerase/dehydratase [Enterococcus sp. JM9B]KAF1303495.1 hypothetical protein BAU16_03895 [Enterococcus sp. JM9B]
MLNERTLKNIIYDILSILIAHGFTFMYLNLLVNIDSLHFFSGLLVFILGYLSMGYYQKSFQKVGYHLSFQDIFQITSSVLVATIVKAGYLVIISANRYFISLALVVSFSLLCIGGIRLIREKIWAHYQFRDVSMEGSSRVLVIGAGAAATWLLRELTNPKNKHKFQLCGLVDDDQSLVGGKLLGIPIIGTTQELVPIIQKQAVDRVVLAIPSLASADYQLLVEKIGHLVPISTIPSIEELAEGKISITKFRSVPIQELLHRREVQLDTSATAELISGATVLVTGAGGSIGSEICRKLVAFHPKKLVLLGHGENSIYQIQHELTAIDSTIELVPIIADIQDRKRLAEVMKIYQPKVVYHAAAHKHVPLMEVNPKEAIKNNIYGTKNVAETAKDAGVERFVMISTDKAVNPTNIMGASKRIAEMLVMGMNEDGKTKFCAVRFGNVLGSRGSVVPLFTKQIKIGGPVTVTDFRMTRYFMTIPEASQLVIHAGTMAQGGEIFILDMGQPIKIHDLAKRMIELSGFTTNEIPIVETGARPGEKLYEELLVEKERVTRQIHEKIFLGKVAGYKTERIRSFLHSITEDDNERMKQRLIEFATNSSMELEGGNDT